MAQVGRTPVKQKEGDRGESVGWSVRVFDKGGGKKTRIRTFFCVVWVHVSTTTILTMDEGSFRIRHQCQCFRIPLGLKTRMKRLKTDNFWLVTHNFIKQVPVGDRVFCPLLRYTVVFHPPWTVFGSLRFVPVVWWSSIRLSSFPKGDVRSLPPAGTVVELKPEDSRSWSSVI